MKRLLTSPGEVWGAVQRGSQVSKLLCWVSKSPPDYVWGFSTFQSVKLCCTDFAFSLSVQARRAWDEPPSEQGKRAWPAFKRAAATSRWLTLWWLPLFPFKQVLNWTHVCAGDQRDRDLWTSSCAQLSALFKLLTEALWFQVLLLLPCLHRQASARRSFTKSAFSWWRPVKVLLFKIEHFPICLLH